MTCLVLDGHQAGEDDEDVELTQSASPFLTLVVEDVEDEDQEEDGCECYPDNRQINSIFYRIKNCLGGSR